MRKICTIMAALLISATAVAAQKTIRVCTDNTDLVLQVNNNGRLYMVYLGDKLINDERVKNADMLFVVGGGRACDCGKYVADVLEKPVFTFPTVASNCASVTQICVMYNEDGSFCNYYYPKKLANHAFINSAVIADSPEKLLWAGIGDALSKECEVIFSSKYADLFHTTLMGRQMSRICTSPLLTYGKKALDDIKAKKPSFELDQVTLDIIISTGIVSNLTTTADDYYYNSSIAHMVYNGTTVTKNAHNHLHGEVVSLGVLCLLTFDKNFEERGKIMKFNASVGLPVCFGDIEVEQSDFEAIAEKATKTTEWAHRAPEANITKETLIACMKETDECGKKFKKHSFLIRTVPSVREFHPFKGPLSKEPVADFDCRWGIAPRPKESF